MFYTNYHELNIVNTQKLSKFGDICTLVRESLVTTCMYKR